MSEVKEVKGPLKYDQGSKRYHRYRIERDKGILGAVHIPKDYDPLPDRSILKGKHPLLLPLRHPEKCDCEADKGGGAHVFRGIIKGLFISLDLDWYRKSEG